MSNTQKKSYDSVNLTDSKELNKQTKNSDQKIKDALQELMDDDLSLDDLLSLRKDINPMGTVGDSGDGYLTFAVINMRKNYIRKLVTTSIIGYLNRMCDEWHVPDGIPATPVYDYCKNPDILDEFTKDKQMHEALKKQVEENKRWMKKRVVVKEFLEEAFQFNPDVHVRSSYMPNPDDTSRPLNGTPAAKLSVKHAMKADADYRALMQEHLNNTKLFGGNNNVAKVEVDKVDDAKVEVDKVDTKDTNLPASVLEMIPSMDTFSRLHRYESINYEALMSATNILYADKAYFDFGVSPIGWHSTLDKADADIRKNRDVFTTDVHKAQQGKWTIVADYKKSRESMKYYNDKTVVLEEIMKQNERDMKIAGPLMENRIRKKKRENIKEAGHDDPAFIKWKAKNTTLKNMGAKSIKYESYLDDDGCPDDAIEVPVYRISHGGAKLEKSKFYTKAVAPPNPTEKK
jgi:hypothetical protein